MCEGDDGTQPGNKAGHSKHSYPSIIEGPFYSFRNCVKLFKKDNVQTEILKETGKYINMLVAVCISVFALF